MADRARFPPSAELEEVLKFNAEFYRYAATRAEYAMSERERALWSRAEEHAREIGNTYRKLTHFKHEAPESEEYWEKWMNHYRKAVGDELYFSGELPPPVPLWAYYYIN